MAENKCIACHESKVRSQKERTALLNRLKRIEGQVRGIASMLDSNAYCVDILTQVSAVSSALDSFSVALFDSHVRSCVKDDILGGRDEILDELVGVISRLIK